MERRAVFRWIILGLALGITVLSVVRYRRIAQEKQMVERLLNETSQALYQTEQEKAKVNAELAATESELSTAKTNTERLQSQLTDAQTHLGQLETQLTSLQQAQQQLVQEKTELTGQVASLSQQKSVLEQRLGSLVELHKAIREVKQRIHEEWVKTRLAQIEEFKRQDQERLRNGNRGFLVKNGTPTTGHPTYRVRVLPADTATPH